MSRNWIPALLVCVMTPSYTLAQQAAATRQSMPIPAVFQSDVFAGSPSAFAQASSGIVRETENYAISQDIADTRDIAPTQRDEYLLGSVGDQSSDPPKPKTSKIDFNQTIEDQAEELTEIANAGNDSERTGLPVLRAPNLDLADIGTGALPEDVTAAIEKTVINLPTGFQRDLELPLAFQTKNWQPAKIYHNPVYFEDMMLEQHGQSSYPLMQPWISGARFIGQLALLPYQFSLNGPCEDISNLGSYRPGSAVPCLKQRFPYNKKALRTQLLSTGAAALALPL